MMRTGNGTGGKKIILLFLLFAFTLPGCTGIKRSLGMGEDEDNSQLFLLLGLTLNGGIRCPAGYIPVGANSAVGTAKDFCVAKYEMKNNGGAVSQAAGVPWDSISRTDAVTACRALGAGYDLIDNAHWQTIARSIESVGANWSGGIVGLGVLPNGFSDNVANPIECPSLPCAASTNDQNGYFGTDNNSGETWGEGAEQRRTLKLSNGQVIWDFAGHLAEWVLDDFTVDYVGTYGVSTTDYVSQLTQPDVKALFGPQGDYGYLIQGGLGYSYFSTSNTGAYRGGDWSMADKDGIYTLYQGYAPGSFDSSGGFRCIWSE